jgi:TolB protein
MKPPNFGRTNGRIVVKIDAPAMAAHLRFILIASILLLAAPAVAESGASPLTIAVPGFIADDPADREIAREIEWVILTDLKRDGAFRTLPARGKFALADPSATHYDPPPADDASGTPPLAYWRAHRAKALVTGKLTREVDGRLKIEARLWDVAGGHYLSGQQYRAEPRHWRQIGHIIADTIYTRLTGRDGRFEADNPE